MTPLPKPYPRCARTGYRSAGSRTADGNRERNGMSLSAAKNRIMFAQANLDSGRHDDVPGLLDAAEAFLRDLPESEEKKTTAERVTAIRLALQDAMDPEEQRRL